MESNSGDTVYHSARSRESAPLRHVFDTSDLYERRKRDDKSLKRYLKKKSKKKSI